MTTKQVSQLDADGYFVGATFADESPLEPGVFLLPGCAVGIPAPVVPEGKRAKLAGGTFVFEDNLETAETEPEDQERTPEESLSLWRNTFSVSRFQARAALFQAGMLEAVGAAMDSPEMDPFSRLAWEEAAEFKRNSPTVASIAPLLGLTEDQLDDLFRFASTITA